MGNFHDWGLVDLAHSDKDKNEFANDIRLARRWKRRCVANQGRRQFSNQKSTSDGPNKALAEGPTIDYILVDDDDRPLDHEYQSYLNIIRSQSDEKNADDDYRKFLSCATLKLEWINYGECYNVDISPTANGNNNVNVVNGCVENDNVDNGIANEGIADNGFLDGGDVDMASINGDSVEVPLDNPVVPFTVDDDGGNNARFVGDDAVDITFTENVNFVDRFPNYDVGVEALLDGKVVNDIGGDVTLDMENVNAESTDGGHGDTIGFLDGAIVGTAIADGGIDDATNVGNVVIDAAFTENGDASPNNIVDLETVNTGGVNLRHGDSHVVNDEVEDHNYNTNNDIHIIKEFLDNGGVVGVGSMDVSDTRFKDNDNVDGSLKNSILNHGIVNDGNNVDANSMDKFDSDYQLFLKHMREEGKSYILNLPMSKDVCLIIKYEGRNGVHDGYNAESIEAMRDFPKTGSRKTKEVLRTELRGEKKMTKRILRHVPNGEGKNKKKVVHPVSGRADGNACKRTSPDSPGLSKSRHKCEMKDNSFDKSYQNFLNSSDDEGGYLVFMPEGGNKVINGQKQSSSDSQVGNQLSQGKCTPGSKTCGLFQTKKEESNKHIVISGYRKGLIKILQKPYDENEYKSLLKEASYQKPVERSRVLRGETIRYKTGKKGLSYLNQHRGFAAAVCAVKSNRPKVLNLLRGFFYWLQNLAHEGSFLPWLDESCLKILPSPN